MALQKKKRHLSPLSTALCPSPITVSAHSRHSLNSCWKKNGSWFLFCSSSLQPVFFPLSLPGVSLWSLLQCLCANSFLLYTGLHSCPLPQILVQVSLMVVSNLTSVFNPPPQLLHHLPPVTWAETLGKKLVTQFSPFTLYLVNHQTVLALFFLT